MIYWFIVNFKRYAFLRKCCFFHFLIAIGGQKTEKKMLLEAKWS